MSRLPNFFIVGAPKAGTTSLYHYLDGHPQVYMSPIKEPNFFADEIRVEHFAADARAAIAHETGGLREFLSGPMREKRFGGIVTDWGDYLRLFANAADESALGEASVCYLWSPTAPERIAGKVPDARILVMLRDPADRAFSQYVQGLGNGAIRWTFREHIERNLRDRSGQFSTHYPFLEFGNYTGQVSRYLARFDQRVWIGLYEDFKRQPLETLRDICRFLGVAEDFSPATDRRYMEAQVPRLRMLGRFKRAGLWQAAARVTPSALRPFVHRALTRQAGTTRMEPADRSYLVDYYREDIGKLAALLNCDLDGWLRPE
jgi:hypothetical protein